MTDPYERLAYPSGVFPRTHPSHLLGVARLFGVPAPSGDGLRVLAIGSGDGRNLLPMALSVPRLQALGVDPAASAVARGRARAEACGLSAVTLRPEGVESVGAQDGSFDCIVCHGVWSWVPPPVQQAILEVVAARLAPGGVAFLSYNTLPGWHLRQPVRDLMRLHAAGFDDPVEQVGQARAIAELLAAHGQGPPGYRQAAAGVAEYLSERADGYLFHEYLAPHQGADYVRDLFPRFADAGLSWLSEAELQTLFLHDLAPEARDAVGLLGRDLVAREQLLDFLRGRSFRSSVLVRAGTPVERQWTPDRLAGLRWDTRLVARDGRLFLGAREVGLSGAAAAVVRAVVDRRQHLPRTEDLPGDPEAVGAALLAAASRGLVLPRALPPAWCAAASSRPRAHPYTRAEARDGDVVTALDHRPVKLGEALRAALVRADGQTDLPPEEADRLAELRLLLPATS